MRMRFDSAMRMPTGFDFRGNDDEASTPHAPSGHHALCKVLHPYCRAAQRRHFERRAHGRDTQVVMILERVR